MAPINFEDKLKDKLENRTLSPSPDAWNKLADRLDKEEKKNNNITFWWLGIAASIIGVILVTTQFYKNDADVKNLPVVVDTQSNPDSNTKLEKEPVKAIEALNNSEIDTKNNQDISLTEVVSISENKTPKKQGLVSKELEIVKPEINNDVLASINEVKSQKDDNPIVETLSQEELKIIEVVDVIKQLNTDDSTVSDKQIDSLLKQAQREILRQGIFDESTKTVNADDLLQDVELELDQTFRDKVFKAVKSSYKSVKTAVAERRN